MNLKSKVQPGKSVFSLPRYGMASTSLLTLVFGILGVVSGLAKFEAVFAILGCLYLIVAVLLWQESRIGMWLGLLLFSVTGVGQSARAVMDFKWRYVFYALMFLVFAWECWQALKLQREERLDDEDSQEKPDSPMISLVLLQREAKYLEAPIVAKYLESAWGEPFGDDGDSDKEPERFVVGENPVYIVKSNFGFYTVHNHDQPYWEDKDLVAQDVNELRIAKAIEDHQAWLSVDLMVPAEEVCDLSEAYLKIGQAVCELADENTLAVLRPENMDINVWSPEVMERLATPGAYAELSQLDNVPVIRISDDDPELIAAIEEAKRRWPEFRAAFEARRPDEKFAIKALITVEDSTECIWVDVVGFEPKFIHGTLANDPVSLGDLRIGSRVEVPIEDMQDWCYFRDDKPVGLFSVQVVSSRMRRQPENEAD